MDFGDILKRILYVLHSGMTGGTFLTTLDLISNLGEDYEIWVLGAEYDSLKLYKYSNKDLNFIKSYPRYFRLRKSRDVTETLINKWSAKEFHNSWLTYIYFEILMEYNIEIVHIMHLINHSFDLPQVANKLNIPVVLSIHDFYFICPFYTLLDENNNYCKGICKSNNDNCYMPWDIFEDINSKEIIQIWRKNVVKLFDYIEYVIMPSEIIKNIFLSVYEEFNHDKFIIIEHGRDFPVITKKYYELPSEDRPIKILCIANNLDILKGSEVIKDIKREDEKGLIEFHFLGNCNDELNKFGVMHGRYEREDFYNKVYQIKPSFIGIFSIWPESYCHTLTESWSCHIPVFGSNIGVIEDRILKNNGGWIIDIDNPKKSYELILNIAQDLEEYCNVVKHLKAMNFKTIPQMVEEYIEIYNKVE